MGMKWEGKEWEIIHVKQINMFLLTYFLYTFLILFDHIQYTSIRKGWYENSLGKECNNKKSIPVRPYICYCPWMLLKTTASMGLQGKQVSGFYQSTQKVFPRNNKDWNLKINVFVDAKVIFQNLHFFQNSSSHLNTMWWMEPDGGRTKLASNLAPSHQIIGNTPAPLRLRASIAAPRIRVWHVNRGINTNLL